MRVMGRDQVLIVELELMFGTRVRDIEAIIGLRWEVILLNLRQFGATETANQLESAAALQGLTR